MVTLDRLDKLNFCNGLSADHLNRLLMAGTMKSYDVGERLFVEGQAAPEIYLILEGEVSLETSMPEMEPMRFQTVGVGDLLGWSPLLGLKYMTSTARAVAPCRVLVLDVVRLNAMSEEDPKFALEVVRRTALTLARRLNSTRRHLVAMQCGHLQSVS